MTTFYGNTPAYFPHHEDARITVCKTRGGEIRSVICRFGEFEQSSINFEDSRLADVNINNALDLLARMDAGELTAKQANDLW